MKRSASNSLTRVGSPLTLLFCVFLMTITGNIWAATYTVSDPTCASIQTAIANANANPGLDTVEFTVDVDDVNDVSCGVFDTGDPDTMYIARVTDNLIIEGNGHFITGNARWITSDGLVNVPGQCPQSLSTSFIVSNPLGFIRMDNGADVTVNDLVLKKLRAIAILKDGGDLTVNNMEATEIYDFYRSCDTPPIWVSGDQNVTINDSLFSLAWNDGLESGLADDFQIWFNAYISASLDNAGTLSIANSRFYRTSIPVLYWAGTARMESTIVEDAGFLATRGGDITIVNSLLMTGESFGQNLQQRIVAARNSSVHIEASTIAVSYLDCLPLCEGPFGPGDGVLIALSDSTIELKASAISVGLPSLSNAGVLIREATGGDVTATASANPNWVQPVFEQNAAALQTILDQPALLTDAPGLPNIFGNPSFYYEAVTPMLDDGGGTPGLLIDAVTDANTTNVLTSPIDGSPITKDVFGNPRTEAGGTVRNIGAVQLGLAPTLSLSATGDSSADLNWTRPLDPGSGAVTGYEVCFGTGAVPDPSAIGTACPGTLQSISNVPDTLSGQVSGLTNGDSYWFLVRGVNAVGGGPWSNAVTGTPYGEIGIPVVTAVPGGNAVDLSWTKPDDGGRGLSGYNVFYRIAGELQWTFSEQVSGGDTLQATVTGLAGGTAYEFGVRAVAVDGTVGGIGIASATPLVVPATFRVTKAYSDINTTPVEVTLSCNNGLPLEQSFTIAPGSPVTFVLSAYIPGAVRCEVTETGSPEGYVQSYNNGKIISAISCVFDTILSGGAYTCAIMNTADNAMFTILKNWVLSGEGYEEASYDVSVDVACSADILSVDGQPVTDPDGNMTVLLGDGESRVLEVDTLRSSASCTATERVTQSGVESSSEGCTSVPLTAGESAECTFTNTVFFEGVPALDRYGMALLALLLLSIGVVGMRKFT